MEKKSMQESYQELTEKTINQVRNELGLSANELIFEKEVPLKENIDFIKRVDLAGYLSSDLKKPFIIIEVKTGRISSSLQFEQLKELMTLSKTKYGIITNGEDKFYFEKNSTGIGPISKLPNKKKERTEKEKKETIIKIPLILYDLFREENIELNSMTTHKIVAFCLSIVKNICQRKEFKPFQNLVSSSKEALITKEDLLKTFSDSNKEFIEESKTFQKALKYLYTINFDEFSKNDWELLIQEFLKYINKSGKESGQFYTPEEITSFMIDLAKPEKGMKVADIASGQGRILSKIKDNVIKKGFEINYDIVELTNLLYLLQNKHNISTIYGDTLLKKTNERFDVVFCDPPIGVRSNSDLEDAFGFKAPTTTPYWINKGLELLKKSGKLIIIVPYSFLIGNEYKKNRKDLLQNNSLLGVFSLPQGLLPNTNIKSAVLVLEKSKEKRDGIFMTGLQTMSIGEENEDLPGDVIIIGEEILSEPHITLFNEFITGKNLTTKHIEKTIFNGTHSDEDEYEEWEKNPNWHWHRDYKKIPFIVEKEDITDDYNLSIERYRPDLIKEKKEFEKRHEIKKIEELAEIIPGQNIPSREYSNKGIKYVRIGDLFDGEVYASTARIIPIKHKKSKALLQKNDVLLTITGTIGKTAIYSSSEDAVASQGIVILRPIKSIKPEYLRSILENDYVKKQLNSYTAGVAIKHVSLSNLKKISIPLIPIKDQEIKIKKIEMIKKEIDSLEKKKKELEESLKKT